MSEKTTSPEWVCRKKVRNFVNCKYGSYCRDQYTTCRSGHPATVVDAARKRINILKQRKEHPDIIDNAIINYNSIRNKEINRLNINSNQTRQTNQTYQSNQTRQTNQTYQSNPTMQTNQTKILTTPEVTLESSTIWPGMEEGANANKVESSSSYFIW